MTAKRTLRGCLELVIHPAAATPASRKRTLQAFLAARCDVVGGGSASQNSFLLGPLTCSSPEFLSAGWAFETVDSHFDFSSLGLRRTVPFAIGLLSFGSTVRALCFSQTSHLLVNVALLAGCRGL